jgi:hypothetical protein
MNVRLDHIAVLTDSLERLAAQLPSYCTPQPIEDQPGEGTREQYVRLGEADAPSLLLVQAVSPGPYQRAIEKRGTGLHHLGCRTDSLEHAVSHMGHQGLFLHAISLATYEHRAVWLCRPGVPFLIELGEVEGPMSAHAPVEIAIPWESRCPDGISSLIPNVRLVPSADERITICVSVRAFSLEP